MFEDASTFSRKSDIRSPKWTKWLRKIMKTKMVTRKKVILNSFYRSLGLKFCVVCFGIGKYLFLRGRLLSTLRTENRLPLSDGFPPLFSTSTSSSSKIRPSIPIFKLGNSLLSAFQKFIIVFKREISSSHMGRIVVFSRWFSNHVRRP